MKPAMKSAKAKKMEAMMAEEGKPVKKGAKPLPPWLNKKKGK